MTSQTLSTSERSQVVKIEISGTMTIEDVRKFMPEIDSALDHYGQIGIVVDLTRWSDITEDAIAADAKAELSLLPKLHRIPRIAVLSNKQWHSAVLAWVQLMLASTEIKVYDSNQPNAQRDAIEFASAVSSHTSESKPEPTIVLIPTQRDDLFAFEYRGHVRSEDLDIALEPLKALLKRDGQFDLFVRMDHFSGFDPSIILKGSVLSLKMASLKKLRRYAIVGADDWIAGVVKMFDPLVSIEMKTFPRDQEQEAWDWLDTNTDARIGRL